MRTIWITGAAGFIGSATTRHFAAQGWRVIGFDRKRPENTAPAFAFHVAPIEGWILEAALAAHGKPDAVFHAASTGTVGQAQANPDQARIDTVGTISAILDTLGRNAPGTRVIYPSSAAVYGNSGGAAALHEDRPLTPTSIYGEYKRDVEDLCLYAGAKGDITVAVVRFFSVYGAGLRKQLPWDLSQKLLHHPPPVTLFGTGAETRDFLNIDDAVGLIAHLATHDVTSSLVVNGGTGLATTIAGFAGLFANALGKNAPIAFSGQSNPNDPTHMRADTARLTSIGFAPRVDLTQGLADYAAWIKAGAQA